MCKIGIKYQYACQAVCAYAHDFRKRPGCVLIGACALIRTNTVILSCNALYYNYVMKTKWPITNDFALL